VEDDPRLAQHLAAGGRAAVLDAAGRLVWRTGARAEPVAAVGAFPCAHGGAAAFNVENLLAASAIGHALGIGTDVIRSALTGFHSDVRTNPGRLNLVHAGPAVLVLDGADSPDDVAALGAFAARSGVAGPRTLALTCSGNRVDAQALAMGGAAAAHFDRFVVFNSPDLRGRPPEAMPALLARGLMQAGIDAARIAVEPDTDRAMALAAGALQAPGLLVVARWDLTSPELVEQLLDQLGAPADQCTTRSNVNFPSR